MSLPVRKMLDVPPVWLAAFAVAVWWGAQWAPLPLGAGLRHVGTTLVALGLALIILAALQFRRHRTSIVPHMRASRLVTSGVFRFSRNPIYLADALILSGLALRWEAGWALIFVPVFCLVIQQRFIVAEEQRLREDFPRDFAEYAENTRRWL